MAPLLVAPESLHDPIQELLDRARALEARADADAARTVYRRIIEVDPDNEEAHKALRHHSYDGKWFESYDDLSRYRRKEAKRMLEEHGLVRFNDEWVPQEDLPSLRKGRTRTKGGE